MDLAVHLKDTVARPVQNLALQDYAETSKNNLTPKKKLKNSIKKKLNLLKEKRGNIFLEKTYFLF